ncbi:hypothetical protein ABN09_08985 [Morganella morganii]|nr:hypothetical protein ABN09_08985 [Morganella morganii]
MTRSGGFFYGANMSQEIMVKIILGGVLGKIRSAKHIQQPGQHNLRKRPCFMLHNSRVSNAI